MPQWPYPAPRSDGWGTAGKPSNGHHRRQLGSPWAKNLLREDEAFRWRISFQHPELGLQGPPTQARCVSNACASPLYAGLHFPRNLSDSGGVFDSLPVRSEWPCTSHFMSTCCFADPFMDLSQSNVIPPWELLRPDFNPRSVGGLNYLG